MHVFKKERQKKHFKAIRKVMQRSLLAFYATQKPEDLHKFRVQVKKMQALLFFIPDRPVLEKGSAYFQAIKPIFKHAGRIRSASLNLQSLSQNQMNSPELKQAEEKILKKETNRFFAKQHAYQKKLKRGRHGLADDFQDIEQKTIVRHYKKQLKKLTREFAKPALPIESLHENRRKPSKRLLYFYASCSQEVMLRKIMNTEYLDQLQEGIGEWRDGVVFDALVGDGHTTFFPQQTPNVFL